jgi:hypothetical protein
MPSVPDAGRRQRPDRRDRRAGEGTEKNAADDLLIAHCHKARSIWVFDLVGDHSDGKFERGELAGKPFNQGAASAVFPSCAKRLGTRPLPQP